MSGATVRMARRGVRALCLLLVVAVPAAGCSKDETGSAEELCAAVGDGSAYATTFEGFDPTDVEAALEQLRAARVELGRLRDAAPGDVRDDVGTLIAYVQGLVDGLDALGTDDPAEAVTVVQRITDEHPDVQAASDRLEAWTEQRC